MLRNYLLVAYRNIVRRRTFSFINITGLSLGIAASLLLFQYVSFELSYDRFHTHAPNIYRLSLDSYRAGAIEYHSAVSFHKGSPEIMASFPQVENYVRLHRADGMINYDDGGGKVVSYFEQSSFYTDSSFFSIFSFPLIKGNKGSVLRSPNSMLMSETAAKKYFGESDPIGKVIKLTSEWQGGDYVVEGVFKDMPENSHVKFDFLFSIEKLLVNQQFVNGGWYWENFYNYLLLKPGTNVRDLESKISSIIDKHLGRELKALNTKKEYRLQPLTSIHLNSNIGYEIDTNGNRQLVYFILIIAFLIMGIAWLNYINLSTAKALERSKEVGIRKIMGSARSQLIKQFLFESSLIIFIATILAAMLLVFLKPYFIGVIGSDITTDLFGQRMFWVAIAGILVVGSFLSGFYPAVVLSSFKPISALKGKSVGNVGPERIRKSMVVLQFAAAILLIIGTITIKRQISSMMEQDLGINVNQKLVIRAPRILKGESYLNEMKGFKHLLSQYPSIQGVTSSSQVPGKEIFWENEFKLLQNPDEDRRPIKVLSVDEDFIPTFKIKLLAGRNFSGKRPSDFGGSVIVNESALKLLGLSHSENAIGQIIDSNQMPKIIGVIKDFQQESLKKNPAPIILQYIPWNNDYLTVSLKSDNIRADIDLVTESYKKVFPNNAIEYFFLDDFFNRQYKAEEQFWNIFKIFSMLAIFIACIGLYGLSSLVISKRTKEIGIRKVLGSSEIGIVALLSKDFLKLVLIAFFLSIPLGWYVMNRWLEDFAHRITIPFWIYALAGGTTLVIAMLTISIQATKAALENPVKSLGSE